MSVGLRIKQKRQTLGLSQKQLAAKSQIAQSSIHYIESNQNSPTYATLQKLALALNVKLTELID